MRVVEGPSALRRALARTTLLVALMAELAWWWASPRGYPPLHPQWWANEVAPGAIGAACVVGLFAAWRARWDLVALAAAGLGVAAAAASLACLLLFPHSGGRGALAPLALFALPACGAALLLRARARGHPRSRAWPTLVCALAAGGLLPLTQRAPDPSTRPAGGPAPRALVPVEGVDPTLRGDPASATLDLPGLTVMAWPLLDFQSRSPDRCWTLFASRVGREGPARRLIAWTREGSARWTSDDGEAALRLERGEGWLRLEAACELRAPVFAHLDAFTELLLLPGSRPAKVELRFSPCPGFALEALPFDYPVGRPLRFACLGADGTFRVLEGASGEKGPFRELAAGPLARDATLAIEVLVDGRPAARIALQDFAAQASTDLSPTAGWGVPQNAVQVWRDGAEVYVSVTLAATGVGRGFQSVGHAPGIYKNRLSIGPP